MDSQQLGKNLKNVFNTRFYKQLTKQVTVLAATLVTKHEDILTGPQADVIS